MAAKKNIPNQDKANITTLLAKMTFAKMKKNKKKIDMEIEARKQVEKLVEEENKKRQSRLF